MVAVNCFEGERRHPLESITQALNLAADVPVIACDARQRESSRDVLVALAEHAVPAPGSPRRLNPGRADSDRGRLAACAASGGLHRGVGHPAPFGP